MNLPRRVAFLLLFSFLLPVSIATAQPVVDAETKPFIGTWSGKENPQLGLPAPRIKILKDGTGAYFLGSPDKPLLEFTWSMGEEQLIAAATDGERFFGMILRPDGKLVWRQIRLPAGVKTEGRGFEKVPSDLALVPGGELSGPTSGTKRHRAGHLASGRFQPTTLKQPQRPHDEGENAAKATRVDLGNGTGSYLKEQRVAVQNDRGFVGKRTHHIELRSGEPADTTRRSQKRQRVR